MNKFIFIVIISSGFFVSPTSLQNPVQRSTDNQEVNKTYKFEYLEQDEHEGTKYGREEQSDGNKVQGVYSINLPDGRTQTVHYEVEDETGFRASIPYNGESKIPSIQEKIDKINQKLPKSENSNKSPGAAIPVPFPMLMTGIKPMVIMKPHSQTAHVPSSKSSFLNQIISSFKQLSTKKINPTRLPFIRLKPHLIRPEPQPIKPEPHPIKPEPHPIKPESHPIKPEPHPIKPEPHPIKPEPHPIKPDQHLIRPEP
ncbi:unnamed protein product, partial [Meganyctiphanes norvegica]